MNNNYQPKFLPKLDEFIKLIKLWESNPNVSVTVQPRADFGYNDIYVTPQDFWVIQHYLLNTSVNHSRWADIHHIRITVNRFILVILAMTQRLQLPNNIRALVLPIV